MPSSRCRMPATSTRAGVRWSASGSCRARRSSRRGPGERGPFFDPGQRQAVSPPAVLSDPARRPGLLGWGVAEGAAGAPADLFEYLLRWATTAWFWAIACRNGAATVRCSRKTSPSPTSRSTSSDRRTRFPPPCRPGRGQESGRGRPGLFPRGDRVPNQMVELPNGDFGFTIVRQFLFDVWSSTARGGSSGRRTPSSRDRRQGPQGGALSRPAQQ